MLDTSRLQNMFELLVCEEPLGVYLRRKGTNRLSHSPAGQGHACIINYLRMAFDRKICVHFAADACTCMGGWVYLGYRLPAPERIVHFVTTGWERRRRRTAISPRQIPCAAFSATSTCSPLPRPSAQHAPSLSLPKAREPLLVTFRCRGEALTGLSLLAGFALDDHNAVVMPFGSGCANIFAWPLNWRRRGLKKAVVGGSDPSCRPFMGVGRTFLYRNGGRAARHAGSLSPLLPHGGKPGPA